MSRASNQSYPGSALGISTIFPATSPVSARPTSDDRPLDRELRDEVRLGGPLLEAHEIGRGQ